jgi:DNA repair photolyase
MNEPEIRSQKSEVSDIPDPLGMRDLLRFRESSRTSEPGTKNKEPETSRTSMNGKPVHEIGAKTVLNLDSGFRHKLLCDGPTFSTGTACAYSCSFCFVLSAMRKTVKPLLDQLGRRHEEIVIRRHEAISLLSNQLLSHGSPRYHQPTDQRVIYASPLVDVAANLELVRETVEACKLILQLTHWHIRLLSKSNLLPKVAQALVSHAAFTKGRDFTEEDIHRRMIFGVSTGTLRDGLAKAFEEGTALVSKRITSLHWLQDNGFRTFGMLCPSLPATDDDYQGFATEAQAAIRADRCEHVWGEVINVRGESMEKTVAALEQGGFKCEADNLRWVSTNKTAWEDYARATFEAHAPLYPSGKLRFMQYVTAPFGRANPARPYWEKQVTRGAVLL